MAREPIPQRRDHPVRCTRYGHRSIQKVRMLGHEVEEGGLLVQALRGQPRASRMGTPVRVPG